MSPTVSGVPPRLADQVKGLVERRRCLASSPLSRTVSLANPLAIAHADVAVSAPRLVSWMGADPLIRRSGHIVQDRLLRSVCWTDIPQLSACDRPYPAARQQCKQQSRHPGADPRPSAFRPDISQLAQIERALCAMVAAVSRCCCYCQPLVLVPISEISPAP